MHFKCLNSFNESGCYPDTWSKERISSSTFSMKKKMIRIHENIAVLTPKHVPLCLWVMFNFCDWQKKMLNFECECTPNIAETQSLYGKSLIETLCTANTVHTA